MGRPKKEGLEYFPMDVDFWEDYKIRRLLRRCGLEGVGVYLCLLSEIYRQKGYYVEWTSSALMSVSEKTRCTEEFVDDVIVCCMEEGLLAAKVYAQYSILTSAGIQRRYIMAIKERIRQLNLRGRTIELKRSIWLLSQEEMKDLKLEMELDGSTTADSSKKVSTVEMSEEEGFIPYKVHKVKESKEKEEESKANKNRGREEDSPAWEDAPAHGADVPAAASPPREFDCFFLRQEKYDELCAQYGKEAVEAKLLHLQDWASERGYHLKKPEIKLRAWLAEDARKEKLKIEAEERAAQRVVQQPVQFKKTGAHAYAQRQYTDDELESLYTDLDLLNA